MALIVGATGAIGWLASFLLLMAGIESMALRYPLALGIAYIFFLCMLWLWLRSRPDDYVDGAQLAELPARGSVDPAFCAKSELSGGGADRSLGISSSGPELASHPSYIEEAGGSLADSMDELAIPLAVIALAIGLAFASLYVIYIAPVLFAELVVDGALSIALYRHLSREKPSHWLVTACRHTLVPFAATGILLVVIGLAMAAFAPGARSIGEVMRYANSEQVRD